MLLACVAPAAAIAQDLPAPVAPAAVVVDPNRVFEDDAPMASGLDVLAGIGLNVSASLVTQWSDNMRRLSDDAVLAQGETRSDWRFTPSMTISAGRPLGRQQIFLNAGVGRDYYARNTIRDKNRLNLGGGLAWRLGQRCNGRIQGSWGKRGTQFATFAEVISSTQETTSFFTSATCQTAGRLVGSASYSWSNRKNRTDESELVAIDRSFANVESENISASIAYALARGQVGVSGNWGNYEFPNQILPTGENNGSKIEGYSLFANYRIGSSLQANASLGYSKVNPRSVLTQDFSGTVWSLGLNYSGPRIGASIGTGRSVNGSGGGNSNYSVGTFYNMNVSYRANDRLSASAGYARTNRDYRGTTLIPGTEPINSAIMDRFFIGTDYRLNRILSFGADLNHQKRSSKPNVFSYDATSLIFSVRANF